MSWRKTIVHCELRDLPGLLAEIPDTPSLFLAAGVPAANTAFTAKPREVMAAVVPLVRLCLDRGIRLVFGAHPAISPMILLAAREAQASPDSVLIFQSLHFESLIPNSTLELASWDAGRLFLTPSQGGDRDASLTVMRTLMLQVPGLRGAVFIGGMAGLFEEDALFARFNPGKPRFAIASTGGAASQLFDAQGAAVAGPAANPIDAGTLRDEDAYSFVMQEVVARL